MEKMIHISATCNAFTIYEVVPEKKSVSRLKTIRDMFVREDKRVGAGKLVVKTGVHNPTLF